MALINNDTEKTILRDRQNLVSSPFTTSGQEMEQVYSYNPGAHTGHIPTHMKTKRSRYQRRCTTSSAQITSSYRAGKRPGSARCIGDHTDSLMDSAGLPPRPTTDRYHYKQPHVIITVNHFHSSASNTGRLQETVPSFWRGCLFAFSSCGWEGKGRYGSFRLQMKRRVCR